MTKSNDNTEQIFNSVVDFEKYFFPKDFEERELEKQKGKPSIYGTGFASNFVNNIRNELNG